MKRFGNKADSRVARPIGKALREALSRYEIGLNKLVAAGKITREDANVIERVATQLGLTEKDTLPYRLNASKYLFEYESRSRVWPERDGSLDPLPRLGLNGTTDPILVAAYHLYRAARLQYILETTGNIEPFVNRSGSLISKSNETEALTLRATLYEEKVIGSTSFGMLSNRFVQSDSGVTQYGSSLTSTSVKRDIVASSKGEIHVTDQRFVFTGAPKSTSFHWPKLNGLDATREGLNLYVDGQPHTLILRLDRPEYRNYIHLLVLRFAQAAR